MDGVNMTEFTPMPKADDSAYRMTQLNERQRNSPVAFAATILFGLFGIGVDEAILAKELWNKGAVVNIRVARMVAVVELVRAGHCILHQQTASKIVN
jgi:hypothetical protein